jgi:hypothetical protein
MQKRTAVLMAAGALAAGMLSCGLAASAYADLASERYPGSQAVSEQKLASYSLGSQSIVRQNIYQTADALPAVRAWYVRRLQVLATENVEPPGGNCAWMGRSRHVAIFQYRAQVLLCTVPPGTRITLDESVALAP